MPTLVSTEPPDLLREIANLLDPHAFSAVEIHGWARDPATIELSRRVMGEAETTGQVQLAAARRLVEQPTRDAEWHRTAYAVIRGIDRALRRVHPLTANGDFRQLAYLATRLLATGRLDEVSDGAGMVVPRWIPPRAGMAGGWGDITSAVHVVPHDVAGRHAAVDPDVDLVRAGDRSERSLGVTTVPFLGPGDVRWNRAELAGEATYEVHPLDPVAARVEDLVQQFDESGAEIAVVPESTLSPRILEAWQQALRHIKRPVGSRLRWIMVGTGRIGDEPRNDAVLLARSDPDFPLLVQGKRMQFKLLTDQIDRYGLTAWLGGDADLDEHIHVATKSRTLESGAGRFAIYICEDFGRVAETGRTIFDAGVSVLVCPVLSKPIAEVGWETGAGFAQVGGRPLNVVVANSLAISLGWQAGEEVRTAVVFAGDGVPNYATVRHELPLTTRTFPLAISDLADE